MIVVGDDLHAELASIDENLIRVPLSPAQEAAAVARRKAIYEELHPETRAGVAQAAGMNRALERGDVSPKSGPTFADSTVKATGKSRSAVYAAISRGEKLGDVLDDVVGTSLDKVGELDALAKLPEEKQKELARRAKDGEAVSARRSGERRRVTPGAGAAGCGCARQRRDRGGSPRR